MKKIYLVNFCGYKSIELDFFRPDATFNPLVVFFGPNGFGKSTFLHAVRILSNPMQFYGRKNDLFFRKLIYNTNYDPTYFSFSKNNNKLFMRAEFTDFENNYITEVNNNEVISTLPPYNSDQDGWSIFIDSDNPLNMNKFQLNSECTDKFLLLAQSIYNLPCSVEKSISTFDMDSVANYHMDFVLQKNEVTVHYKRMSDGEKKICTLLRTLCEKIEFTKPRICLLDNIEMHIYFKRHPVLIDKLIEIFPNVQFITTSHSQTLIDHVEKKLGKESLVDLEVRKNQL